MKLRMVTALGEAFAIERHESEQGRWVATRDDGSGYTGRNPADVIEAISEFTLDKTRRASERLLMAAGNGQQTTLTATLSGDAFHVFYNGALRRWEALRPADRRRSPVRRNAQYLEELLDSMEKSDVPETLP